MNRPLTASILAMLLFVAPTLAAQEAPVSEEAREKFRAGVALMNDPDGARYEEAYLAFKAAYEISPSPNILGNLGLSAMKLERDEEAISAYTTYLAKGTGIEAGERNQIESDLKTLKNTLAHLDLTVTPGNAAIVDERHPSAGAPVRNRYRTGPDGKLKIGVRAGRHKVTIGADGLQEQTIEIELLPGKTETKSITLTTGAGAPTTTTTTTTTTSTTAPQTEMERPVPVSVWAMLGVTGALAVGAGVVGGLALANKSEYDDTNDGSNPTDSEDLRSKGLAMNITTDVLIGASAAAGAVTLILFLTRPEVPVAKQERASVIVVPTGTGAALYGTF